MHTRSTEGEGKVHHVEEQSIVRTFVEKVHKFNRKVHTFDEKKNYTRVTERYKRRTEGCKRRDREVGRCIWADLSRLLLEKVRVAISCCIGRISLPRMHMK